MIGVSITARGNGHFDAKRVVLKWDDVYLTSTNR